ncbi:hypothetical protein BURK2_04531 [Burkholderiales bacterium]|nr:MAG: hypothetical protein F9K47_12440 [Burkholderiales bacterium]CAG1012499.1 hypothetical protein BURK2_04531 [Burkholderiales bacterium]
MAAPRCALLLLAVVLVAPVKAEEPVRFAGHILGRPCAQSGRIGECPLKWADDAVFRSLQGEIYEIDVAASGIRRERLDEAYGLEVELYGTQLAGKGGAQVAISQLNIVKPPGNREFFKG